MTKYKVIKITEQDFGCEERPEGQKYCVDVLLSNTENNNMITVSVPDAELYKKNIDVNSYVYYDGKSIENI